MAQPVAPVLLSPSSQQLQPGQTAATQASQANYGGPFSIASSTCAGVATVAKTANGFSVTAIGSGTCTVTIEGASGQRAVLTITASRLPVPNPAPGPAPHRP
jgi:hypothetical protein